MKLSSHADVMVSNDSFSASNHPSLSVGPTDYIQCPYRYYNSKSFFWVTVSVFVCKSERK